MFGEGGKYDPETQELMKALKADMVVLVVGPGAEKGPGFSLASRNVLATLAMPTILRQVADRLEADLKRLVGPEHSC